MGNLVMEEARTLVAEIAKRRGANNLSAQPDPDLTKFILTVTNGRRFSLVSTPQHLISLWAEIRSNKLVTDFVMEASTELLLRLGATDYAELVNGITFAYSAFSDPGFSCMDQDLVKRLPGYGGDANAFHKHVYANPWYVFLVLLETLEVSTGRQRPPSKS